MTKGFSAALLAVALVFSSLSASATGPDRLSAQLEQTGKYMQQQGNIAVLGAEWRLLGLLRGGLEVTDAQRAQYYWAAMAACEAGYPSAPDSARMALALKALGYDLGSLSEADSPATRLTGSFMKAESVSDAAWIMLAAHCTGVYTADEGFVALILQHQRPNGGFSLDDTGRTMPADPDLTAMMLQALACFQADTRVQAAIEAALAYLSAAQQPNGGFKSMGNATAESAAQIILAMTALGIPQDDPRFVKNGSTVLDALLAYALPDGSFCHMLGGSANGMATEQALLALVALERQQSGAAHIWDMGDVPAAAPPESLPARHPDITAPRVVQPQAAFSDLTGCPQAEAVVTLARLGIVEGVGEGRFAPEIGLTRAQFAALLVRALGLPMQGTATFDDVPAGAWYVEAVATAVHYGLATGLSATHFAPQGAVTVQEAALMLSRAAQMAGQAAQVTAAEQMADDILAVFDDYRQGAQWARGGLAYCVDSGILTIEGMLLEPARPLSRGETAGMLYNLLVQLRLI